MRPGGERIFERCIEFYLAWKYSFVSEIFMHTERRWFPSWAQSCIIPWQGIIVDA